MSSTLLAEAASNMEKANAAVSMVGQKLSNTQVDVADLRNRIGHLALVATFDPEREGELVEARSRLAESEARMRELAAAEVLAGNMARDARQKALQATAQADWDAAGVALEEAVISAQALDAMAKQFGDLYGRVQTELRRAVALAAPHMLRDDYRLLSQVPDLNETLKLVIANSGGPAVDPRRTLHMSATEISGASVARQVERHRHQVMGFRPADTTGKESDHD